MAYARQFCPAEQSFARRRPHQRSVVTRLRGVFAEALGLERELQQFAFHQ